MKNANKAFTLVELLAVIVILGIIAFLIFPNVSKTIEESREKAYARQISILEQAAQKYTKENIDKLSSDKRCISIDTLISSGYIAAKDKDNGKYVVLNPKTDEPLSGGVQVKYDDTYNQYEYTYNSNCNKKITVTLDANGGTLGSSSSTKDVEYYNDYGELPTPTKTGYKFLGWNGRNLYNVNDRIRFNNDDKNAVKVDDDWIEINSVASQSYYNYYTNDLDVSENTNYNVVLEMKTALNVTGWLALTSDQIGKVTQFVRQNVQSNDLKSNTVKIYSIKTNSGANAGNGLRTYYKNENGKANEKFVFRISVLDVDNTITADNFDYEPYYITPSTVVVQENNHTICI